MSDTTWTPARRSELVLRMMSAALLVPFAVYVVWGGGWITAIGCAFIGAVMAYEWVRMTNSPAMKVLVCLAFLPTLIAAATSVPIGAAALGICSVLAYFGHPSAPKRLLSGFGLLYTAGMPFAVYALRVEPAWNGLEVVLVLMVLVWLSDTGAFFTGRTLGGPSLASISPSKTWSGAFGGVISCAVAGAAVAMLLELNPVSWAIVGVVISVVAQAGDMFESILKRRLGVKDSSRLLPGHGGVLDRVDGLGAAAIVSLVCLYGLPALVTALGLQA